MRVKVKVAEISIFQCRKCPHIEYLDNCTICKLLYKECGKKVNCYSFITHKEVADTTGRTRTIKKNCPLLKYECIEFNDTDSCPYHQNESCTHFERKRDSCETEEIPKTCPLKKYI